MRIEQNPLLLNPYGKPAPGSRGDPAGPAPGTKGGAAASPAPAGAGPGERPRPTVFRDGAYEPVEPLPGLHKGVLRYHSVAQADAALVQSGYVDEMV